MTSMGKLIDEVMDHHYTNRPFMVVDDASTSYCQFVDRIARQSSVFQNLGLPIGSQVGIATRLPLDLATLLLAGLRSGYAMISLNPDLMQSELAAACKAAKLTHVFTDADIADGLAETISCGLTVIRADTIPARGSGLVSRMLSAKIRNVPDDLHSMLDAARPDTSSIEPAAQDPSNTALMLLTSGTTSQPKVVELSSANLVAQIRTFQRLYGYAAASKILNPLPMHFTDGMLHGPIVAFLTGATLYRPERFNFSQTSDLLDTVRQDGITHLIVVPALLSLINRLDDSYDDAFLGKSFQFIRSSGDYLPLPLWNSIQQRFKTRVVNTYGMSETVCEALYCGPADTHFRMNTVGKPIDCEARIVSDSGQDLAIGETGELLIRGENVMKGYLDQPDLSSDAFTDGWLKTGDYAARDTDGFIRIVGRKKNLIVSGGINIQPQDISDVLLAHEDIADAHVVGLPDPDFNQVVACAIVPVSLQESEALFADEIKVYCSTKLAPQKVPRKIIVVSDLPRNAAGKVLHDQLIDRFSSPGTSSTIGSVADNVLRIAARAFGCRIGDLTAESTPFSVPGWDSLAHINLIDTVEREFGVSFSTTEVINLATLGDLITIVAQELTRHITTQ